MSRLLPGTVLVLLAGAVAGAEPPLAPAPRRIPIEELVKQLGHPDLEPRDAATARLSALAIDPPPELLAALKSENPEMRDRAERVVRAMRWNVTPRLLPRGQRFAEQGRVDLFVAATAAWDLKPDDDRLWEPPTDLGRRLIEKAGLKGDRKPHNSPSSFKDYATYKRLLGPRFTRSDEPYVCPDPQKATPPVLYYNHAIQAPGVTTPLSLGGSLIVSRGSVRVAKIIHSSAIFANGDVTVSGGLYSSVVVCDGDVTVTDSLISQCLVVARGNITVKGNASECTLFAGGKVKAGVPRDPDRVSFIKENEPNPLGFITFFELSTVGLEVKVADKAVRVGAVAAGKPCEKAGLKVGDDVLSVNGKGPTDAESLRRLLRDALAVGDATVKVRRGNEPLTLKVALPE